MFVLVTGEIGSGKSAYAVDYILKKEKEYNKIYVNINGFKMRDNIEPLNFIKVYEIITQCKLIYDTQVANLGNGNSKSNVIDAPIIDYLIEIGFLENNVKYKEYLEEVAEREKESSFRKLSLAMFRPIKKVDKYVPTLYVIDEAKESFWFSRF
ncbi:MAG: zonular occludens toxin domain-containing protein [Sulfurovum sp.]|nr:zonular occludens toxin domain-containing protein [Sulfurovum sp.]